MVGRGLPRKLVSMVLMGVATVLFFHLAIWTLEGGALLDHHLAAMPDTMPRRLVRTRGNVIHSGAISNHYNCEKIHIAIAFDNPEEGRQVSLLVKTIMFSRQSPLALHFLTSPSGQLMISALLSTWELPGVSYTVHADTTLRGTSPVEQYFLLLKSLEDMLPTTLEKVIILDPRMRILTDLRELWDFTSNYSNGKVMALASNIESEKFYVDVMAINLQRYRESDIRRQIITSNVQSWDSMQQALSSQKGSIQSLPCQWMVRLEKGYDYSRCLRGSSVKAIWWSTDVYFTNAVLDPYIEEIHTWSTSDPNLLRHQPSPCYHGDVNTNKPNLQANNTCNEFRYSVQLKKLTHYFYIGEFDVTAHILSDITLMVVFTMSRFDVLLTLIKHWGGPLVAVLYGDVVEVMRLPNAVQQANIDTTKVIFHVVYTREIHFPVNYLRNVAIKYCSTEYAIFADVDLVPNVGAYSYLKDFLAKHVQAKQEKIAYVVPAFQAYEETPLKSFPANKSEMVQLLAKDVVSGYGMRRGWNLGHKPTDFTKWQSASEPYQAVFADAFEPYVVLPAKTMPYYKEVLFNRMGDKISYALYLYHRGYKFIVLPEAFLIHLPHDRKENNIWPHSQRDYFRCGSVLITEFKEELKRKYPMPK